MLLLRKILYLLESMKTEMLVLHRSSEETIWENALLAAEQKGSVLVSSLP